MTNDDASINALLETLSEEIAINPIIPSSESSIETIEKLDDAEIIEKYDNFFENFIKISFLEIKTTITYNTPLPSQITNPSLYIFIPTILNNQELIGKKNLSKPQPNIFINTFINNSQYLLNLLKTRSFNI